MFLLKCGNTSLPGPTKMTVNDEIIWTSDTGRTLDGTMMGDVVAEKKNISIMWEWLTAEETVLIRDLLIPGFFPLVFTDCGTDVSIEGYRGTLNREFGGEFGGCGYYSSVSVNIVQR